MGVGCAHFTICPNRPAASDDVDRRGKSPKAMRGLPGAAHAVEDGGAAPDFCRSSGRAPVLPVTKVETGILTQEEILVLPALVHCCHRYSVHVVP